MASLKEVKTRINSVSYTHLEDSHIAGYDRVVFHSAWTCAYRLVIESGNIKLYHVGRGGAYT